MRMTFPQLLHGPLERGGGVHMIETAAIERFHKLRSAAVVYIPQCQEQATSPGEEQASHQSNQFVTRSNCIESGRATAQGDLIGVEPQLIEISQGQECVPQSDTRKHGSVPAEKAMSRNMDQPALGPLLPQDGLAGVAPEKYFRMGKNASNRLKFLINARRLRIRNTH